MLKIYAKLTHFIFFAIQKHHKTTNPIAQIVLQSPLYKAFSHNIILQYINMSKLQYGIVRIKNLHTLKPKEKLLTDFNPIEIIYNDIMFDRLQRLTILNSNLRSLERLIKSRYNFRYNMLSKEFSYRRMFIGVRISDYSEDVKKFIIYQIKRELKDLGVTDYKLIIIQEDFETLLNVNYFNPKNMDMSFLKFLLQKWYMIDLDETSVFYLLVISYRPLLK